MVKRQRGCSLNPDLSNVVVLEGVGLWFPCSRVVETARRPNYYGDFCSRRGKITSLPGRGHSVVECSRSSGGYRGSIAMVVGLTHSSFKRLASEPNGTVITPGRSDAFPYRFQEVAVATTTSTYTCIISSQPRSSQVHYVSQTPPTRVGRTLYRIYV